MNSNTDAQSALHQIDDKVFKITFQTRDALFAFLKRYIPERLLKHIDLEALELDVTEYVNKDLRKFQSDVVWRTTFKDKPLKIVLLFEHKKDLDKAVFVQILLYLCLIWLFELQDGKPMSCILPILVHQGAPFARSRSSIFVIFDGFCKTHTRRNFRIDSIVH